MSEIISSGGFENTWAATITSTPSTAASVLTVQSPGKISKTIRFIDAHMYCAAACTITLERYGTNSGSFVVTNMATTTKFTPNNLNPNSSKSGGGGANPLISISQCYSASNITAGTVLDTFVLTAGQTLIIDMTQYILDNNNNDSLTLRTNSISAACTLTLRWREL